MSDTVSLEGSTCGIQIDFNCDEEGIIITDEPHVNATIEVVT